ncbi:MAG: hypothetical protein ACJ739_07000 [Acidimicrobiales bacterium]
MSELDDREHGVMPGDDEPAPSSRRWLLWAGIAVVLLLLVAGALVLVNDDGDDDGGSEKVTETTETTDPGSDGAEGARGVTDQFSGTGDDRTEVFEVAENWEVRWKASGSSFELELFTEDDTSRGTIVTASDEAEGSTFVVEGGRFYLAVTTDGDWSVDIVTTEE